eukprot:5673929-Amphidinium_carterae.1
MARKWHYAEKGKGLKRVHEPEPWAASGSQCEATKGEVPKTCSEATSAVLESPRSQSTARIGGGSSSV